ncbi:MAG: HAMP domain-containing histidine kinase, partial [Chitinophagales bacterium]|nr:HAMP domain-containing histidine kinase [Chitinophagales bacterium]
ITLIITSTIKSLVLDSKISLDATNCFILTFYSVISFIILCLCALIFFHLSHILLTSVFKEKIKLRLQLLVVSVVGLIILSFQINNISVLLNMLSIAWLLLYIIILNYRQKDLQLLIIKSSFFIVWIAFFSITITALVMQQNTFLEYEQRKRWAKKLAEQTDPNSEALLQIATLNFSNTFLSSNFNRFQQEFSNKFLKDSLVNENFSGYLNKYDTRIYTYDSLLNPLFNDDALSYAVIKTIILNQGKETNIPNLYSYENTNGRESYIYERVILKDSIIEGYLFVTVKPKRFKSEALYPELFRQVQSLSNDFNTHYAYAIYNNNILVNSFNDYSFQSSISKNSLPKTKFKIRSVDGFNELWYNIGTGKVVVIVKKHTALLEFMTLFAYLFCTFIIVLAIFHISIFIFKTRFKKDEYKNAFRLSIRNQIHATIIMVSVFSFIVIGATTISYFIYRFHQTNEEKLLKNIQIISNQVESKLKNLYAHFSFDDALDFTTPSFGNNFEKTINEISEIYNSDINIFNTAGTLIASTQPYIYNKQLLSNKMQPNAFIQLTNFKKNNFIQSEKIAELEYLSIYASVKDDEGKVYAYINIPYLNSQTELSQEISEFLATIMNLNAFIFLLAGVIAFMVTDKITVSLSLISEKMKAINIEQHNEEIEWGKNDEIGILITEYNKMVKKLEASAKALAQTEREGAWREMARQVAHEIKNPLTPMKLSIQYLQKSINNKNENIKELTNRVASTLIEQIEQLSKIAGDFSQFANIENIQPEIFNLSNTISSLIELHKTRENIQFNWQKDNEVYLINADKTQISRLFSNLILNAIEASSNSNFIRINIYQKKINNTVETSIEDFGLGISDEMKQKIFTPNFTTKTSGTGLGLAICKAIVEKANGSITFTTEKNIGTTFKVTLPLV